jgi:hypothetical protein
VFWVPKRDTSCMIGRTIGLLLSAVAFLSPAVSRESAAANGGPEFTNDGQLKLPQGYREWIYLTSGFDMSYDPAMQMGGQHKFDNVFVNPEAYKAFVNTGTWPDKTILVLEGRAAQGKGSINQAGHFQAGLMDLELHVKDEARFPGKWAFFAFNGEKTAKAIPTSADCYSCHAQHAAVDTTFVQFYPTLLPIAKGKRTLSPSYLKEAATPGNP